MKKHKFKLNSILILLLTIFLLWYVLKDNFNESITVFMSANVFWLIVCFIIYILYFLLETLLLKKLINEHKKDYTFKSALKLYIMTKFFNGVTPFSTGGQPLQVYELKKEGVRVTDGTTVIIKHFLIFQTSLVTIACLALLFNTIFKVIHATPFLNTLVIIGFIINFFLLAIVYLLSTNIIIGEKIILFVINILAKLKIVKHKKEQGDRFVASCIEYNKSYKSLISNKKKFFGLILMETLALLFTFAVPIFIFKALGYVYDINALAFLLISIYVFFVGSYVPIPGGTGGMEYAFFGFFSYYVSDVFLSPAVILWRLIEYYLPMLLGGIVFNYEKGKRDRIEEKKAQSVN